MAKSKDFRKSGTYTISTDSTDNPRLKEDEEGFHFFYDEKYLEK